MKLTVIHKTGNNRDLNLIRSACQQMLSRLLKPEQMARITLHVKVTTLQDDLGDISVESDSSFYLRLHHEMDTLLLIVTLAHELVHLSQVMTGRLVINKNNDLGEWVWDGESYGCDPYLETGRSLPWEIDANERECDLARHFVTNYIASLNAS